MLLQKGWGVGQGSRLGDFVLHDVFSLIESRARARIGILFLARVLVNFIDIGAMTIALILLGNLSTTSAGQQVKLLDLEWPTELWFAVAVALFVLRAFLVLIISGLFIREVAKAEAKTARLLLAFELEQNRKDGANPELAFNKLQANFVTGLRKLFSSSAANLLTIVSESALILLLLVAGLLIAPIETAFLLAVGLMMGGALFITSHFAMGSQSSKLLRADQDVYKALLTLSNGAEEIRFSGSLESWLSHLEKFRRKYSSSNGMIRVLGMIPRYFIETLLIGGLLVFAYFSLESNFSAEVELQLVVLLLLRLVGALVPLQTAISNLQAELGGAKPVVKRLGELSALRSDNEEKPNSTASHIMRAKALGEGNTLELSRLAGIRSSRLVFEPITHTFRFGQSYAVVGESGSGKSTLLNLILNQSLARQGELEFQDGTKPSVADIHYMGPDSIFFEGTIAENVALLPPGSVISDDLHSSIMGALDKAKLLDELVQLGMDSHSMLTNSGGLSSGQLQRIAIARVFVSPKPILILDEPTSALDGATEGAVIGELIDFAKSNNRVLVYATHSFISIERADEVVVVKGDSGN